MQGGVSVLVSAKSQKPQKKKKPKERNGALKCSNVSKIKIETANVRNNVLKGRENIGLYRKIISLESFLHKNQD